jgi:hypothetical protein
MVKDGLDPPCGGLNPSSIHCLDHGQALSQRYVGQVRCSPTLSYNTLSSCFCAF